MSTVLTDVEEKINDFIKSNPTYQKACTDAFTKYDVNRDKKISNKEATQAMEYILNECEQPLLEWGIKLDKNIPIDSYIKKYDVNKDGKLDKKEFEDFYKKVLVVCAVKAGEGIVKKYGLAVLIGWAIVGGAKYAIKQNVSEDVKSKLWLAPSWILGPVLGTATWWAIDQAELVDKCKKYLKDNNLLTANQDPAAPTATLSAKKPTSKTTTSKPRSIEPPISADAPSS